jgi:hypothetical protein
MARTKAKFIDFDASVFGDDGSGKLTIQTGSAVSASSINISDTLKVGGDFSVGLPTLGKDATFGEGESHTNGMLIYRGESTSSLTQLNVAVSASSLNDGLTLPFWLTASREAVMYVSSDLQDSNGEYLHHHGITYSLQNAPSGSFIIEYYDGDSWEPVNYMVSKAEYPYYSYSKELGVPTASYQLRYDVELPLTWASSSIGTGEGSEPNRYWTRYRIDDPTGYGTIPEVDQLKLHSSGVKINSDGIIEYFGKSRIKGMMNLSNGLVEPAANNDGFGSTNNNDIIVGSPISVGRQDNSFDDLANQQYGIMTIIPNDMDTSSPVTVNLYWFLNTNNAGEVDLLLNTAHVNISGSIDNTVGNYNLQTISKTVTIGGNLSNELQKTTVKFYFSDVNSHSESNEQPLIAFGISREGATDSFTGSFNIAEMSGEYTKWSNGNPNII